MSPLRAVSGSSGGTDLPYRELVEALPHMVWTCREDGACDYLSPQWIAYTGVPEAQQLGEGWLDRLHPADVERARAAWAAAVAAGGTFDLELRVRRADGTHRWFKSRAVPTVDRDGRVVRWCGTNTDVQDLRDAQEAVARSNQELEARIRARTEELEAANARLRASAAQLEAAQRLTGIGSWELDGSTGEVVWSDQLWRLFGLARQGSPPAYPAQAGLFEPESWERLSAAVQRALASGEAYELRLTFLRSDGERRTGVARAEVVRGQGEDTGRLVGTFQDKTEQLRLIARLGELAERLQLATSAARMGVWDWDIAGGSLIWDDTMHQLYETTAERFDGSYETWVAAIHPDDRAAVEIAIAGAVAEARDLDTEFRLVCPDGRVKHLRAAARVERYGSGRATRMVGVNWDVTEKRAAENALRASGALQRAILAHAGPAIIATDRDGVIQLFNHAAEELLGYAEAEVVGVATPAILHDPEEIAARAGPLERELGCPIQGAFDVLVARSRTGGADASEWIYVRKDGSRVSVLLTVSALRDDDGAIVGYLGVAVDLTARKQQERELVELNRLLVERSAQAESASRAKSAFVANVSHEIRTPLGAITGMVYLLTRTVLGDEQRTMVATVERSARTLLRMINDVLDLSKIEANQLTLESRRFSIVPIIDELGAMMAGFAVSRNLELVITHDPDLPDSLIGDRGRVLQILMNLVSNAIKFTDKGTVRVDLGRVGGAGDVVWVRLAVRDTGTGVDAELLPRLFSRFVQGSQPAGRAVGGTGLGLAIVKELATLMGGRVGAESTAGIGTEVWCEIPFRVARSAVTLPSSSLSLLVVDDHDDQRRAVAASAARFGWRVELASSGEEAVAKAVERARSLTPFDVVIMDWKMPGMDGLETLAALRSALEPRDAHPGVVMATAYDAAELRDRPSATLADAILAKPVTPSTLFDAVGAALTARTGSAERLTEGAAPEAEVERLRGARILVVDDSDINRDIARRVLALEGAEVVTAAGGQQALDHLGGDAPAIDLVLLDVQMPDIDGIETVRRIRQDPRHVSLPIIALTAGALANERSAALAAGMNDFIAKPFEPDHLIESILRHVERSSGAHPAGEPRATRPASPRGWPAIAGIDAEDAALRLGRDQDLFIDLLGRLRGELEDFAGSIASSSGVGDPADLADRAHRLGGMAGNLGARDLHRAAARAERSLRDDPGALQGAALLRLRLEADRLLAALGPVLRESPPGVAVARVERPLAAGALESFLRLLDERDLEALSVFADLAPALQQRLGGRAYRELSAAIDGLDFSVAMELAAGIEVGG